MKRSNRSVALALMAATSLTLGACGGSDGEAAPTTEAASTEATEAAAPETTEAAPAEDTTAATDAGESAALAASIMAQLETEEGRDQLAAMLSEQMGLSEDQAGCLIGEMANLDPEVVGQVFTLDLSDPSTVMTQLDPEVTNILLQAITTCEVPIEQLLSGAQSATTEG